MRGEGERSITDTDSSNERENQRESYGAGRVDRGERISIVDCRFKNQMTRMEITRTSQCANLAPAVTAKTPITWRSTTIPLLPPLPLPRS